MVPLIRSLLPGGSSLLKPETMALMMTNQLPDGMWISFPIVGELRGRGFGLSGALISEPSPLDHPDAMGEFFWSGYAGTQWWISPRENVAGLMMTRRQMAFLHPFAFEFKRLAYEAVRNKNL
jgi:CubicO group peptidase (beta-lactamase class C family)